MTRLADIFTELEATLINNQKNIFLSYPNSSITNIREFQNNMFSKRTLLESENLKAIQRSYKAAVDNITKTIDRGYNAGINNLEKQLDTTIDREENDRIKQTKDNSRQVIDRMCRIAFSTAVMTFSSIVSSTSAYNAPDIYSAVDMAQSLSLEKGVVGNISLNGASMNIATFADVIEGEYEHAGILSGEGHARDEIGNHLVVVSEHFGCCDKCSRWEGRILIDDVFAEGKPDGEHELLSTAIADGLFHPNCRHRTRVVLKGEKEPKDRQNWTEKQNREQYKAAQRQRQIERKIREYKRREEGALTDAEKLKAHQKVLEWQEAQREHIDKSNSKGGLRLFREYERERVGGGTNPQLSQEFRDYANYSDDINYLNLPFVEKKALTDYLSSESYKINYKLRECAELSDHDEQLVNNLNAALDKFPKVKDVYLTRDMTFIDDESMNDFLAKHMTGEEVEYKSFTSATTAQSYNDDSNVRIIIRNAYKAADLTNLNKKEQEALYKAGSRFKVLTKTTINGKVVIELEEL